MSWRLRKEHLAGSTVFPWQEHGFKTSFHDAISLRYGCDPARVLQHCSCSAKFNRTLVSCPKGTIRHNEICDLTANLLTEVDHEVQVKPHLQPITGEQFRLASSNVEDGTHLDISVNGF